METFTENEMNLMKDSFNGVSIDSKFSHKYQLFGVFDEGNYRFNKWQVDKKLLKKKIKCLSEADAKEVIREILNFWGRVDDEQAKQVIMQKALTEENYELAGKIHNDRIPGFMLQDIIKNMDKPK